jgi:hypothetical protein
MTDVNRLDARWIDEESLWGLYTPGPAAELVGAFSTGPWDDDPAEASSSGPDVDAFVRGLDSAAPYLPSTTYLVTAHGPHGDIGRALVSEGRCVCQVFWAPLPSWRL